MKRKSIVPIVLLYCVLASCKHHGDLSLKYTESKHYYSMDAWFRENKTRAVEEYMNDRLKSRTNVSFVNTRIDAKMGLDDHTTFFIEKFSGHLKIEMDKRENTVDSYKEIKSLCEGIKEVLK